MIYLILFIYIIIYFKILNVKDKNFIEFVFYLLPVMLLLVIILSLQDNVGTDYSSYIELASGNGDKSIDRFYNKGEYLSYYLLKFTQLFNNPQLFFLFSSIIMMTFFTLILYEIKKLGYKLDAFFYLYFSLSLVFFNQFNGIRQYIAIYIFIYAVLLLNKNKKKQYLILIVIASLFHDSAIFLLPIVLTSNIMKRKISIKFIILLSTLSLLIYIIDLNSIIEFILYNLENYKHLVQSENYFLNKMSVVSIITKILKLVIIIYCLIFLNNKSLNINERYFLNMSCLSVIILILSFSSNIIWRMYQYFDIFLIFPVLIYTKKGGKYTKYINLYLFIILIIKIIVFPKGEYLYNSILFK